MNSHTSLPDDLKLFLETVLGTTDKNRDRLLNGLWKKDKKALEWFVAEATEGHGYEYVYGKHSYKEVLKYVLENMKPDDEFWLNIFRVYPIKAQLLLYKLVEPNGINNK